MQFLLLRVLWKLSGHQLVIPTYKHMLQISKHCVIKETTLNCSHMVLQFTSKEKSTVFSLLVLNIITTLCFLSSSFKRRVSSHVIFWPVYISLIVDKNLKLWALVCLNKQKTLIHNRISQRQTWFQHDSNGILASKESIWKITIF